MKKIKINQIKTLTVKIVLEDHFQTVQIIQEINHLITLIIEADHQTKEIHVISHKTCIVNQVVEILSIELIIHDQTQTDQNIRLIPVPTHTLGLDTIQMIDQENHCRADIEIIPTIGIEATQIIKTNDIKIIDHEIIQTADHITKDLTTTIIKIDHEITHKKGTQIITIDKETTLNHLIEIIHVILIPKTKLEAILQKIKDKQIKYKQLKKPIRTTLVLII